ncbi:MAG: hypothetical protein ACJAZ3_000842 [Sphingobacteriales bacterium]|jgi:hypothetical protein
MRISEGSLKKLDQIFTSQGYKVRMERGNFKSGTCMLLQNKMIVINKFASLEIKLSTLSDLLIETEVDETLIPEELQSFYFQLKQTKLNV